MTMYDIFISHASEDKSAFVDLLAKKLATANVSVWYDTYSLRLGDSLTESIQNGLKNSRYAIVVLSHNFFAKKWPVQELNALLHLKGTANQTIIIPIWYKIGIEEVLNYSPFVADIVAIDHKLGMRYIVKKIVDHIQPQLTSIQHADNHLKLLGYSPPKITDEWWLNMVEYDGSDPNMEGWAFPGEQISSSDTPESRGMVITNKVLKMLWQEKVTEEKISQLTPPERFYELCFETPGIVTFLTNHLDQLIGYAPQLTIKGLGGPFEQVIESAYQSNAKNFQSNDSTTCDERFALRDPNFGFHPPGKITRRFIRGKGDIYASKCEDFDYLIGLLSDDISWMPIEVKEYLLKGFIFSPENLDAVSNLNLRELYSRHDTDTFFLSAWQAIKNDQEFVFLDQHYDELFNATKNSSTYLGLTTPPEVLMERFLAGKFIESILLGEKYFLPHHLSEAQNKKLNPL